MKIKATNDRILEIEKPLWYNTFEKDKERMISMRNYFLTLFQAEATIRENRSEAQWLQIRNVTVMAIAAFLLMSALNVYQHSGFMLATTLSAALVLSLGLMAGWRRKDIFPVELAFFSLSLVLLTWYILVGGNEGFALLWVTLVPPFFTMLSVKSGLALSVYFLLLLVFTFYGPLDGFLQYDYPQMIRLRFPALYLIDCVLAVYIVRKSILAQSELILAGQQIRQASFLDATTGMQNRAAYLEYVKEDHFAHASPLTVVYMDVNGLHELNNTYGHQAGDEMLRFVGKLCMERFSEAKAFRLGGDEFLLIVPGVSLSQVERRMEDMCREIQAAGYSIAYGVEHRGDNLNLDEMVHVADSAMLEKKAEHYRELARAQR